MKRISKKQIWIFAVGQLGWSILGGIISAWSADLIRQLT